ncbi:murein hydrolase activator EnvC [Stappia sp. MMSF_3263]|uniref:murein hydrolase activator EnvC family protein n=1 Tax=Stappia sp. MMSF_3263 TaxID=3046693 RepID=UPI00273FC716|nr:M23 family metallopeptidase [Stappia sp. MMSF_3263]
MSMQTFRPSSRLLSQTAIVLVLAALAGACSGGVERFEDPIFTGNTANQRAMLGTSQPSFDDVAAGPRSDVRPQVSAKVERSTLPPPTSANSRIATGSIPARAPTTPTRPATFASVPTPRASTVSTTPVTNAGEARSIMSSNASTGAAQRTVRGWTTAGATQVSARSGDTVASMSRRYGIPQHVLAEINGVEPNGSFPAGQRVTIPTYVHGAPNIAAAAPSQPVRLPSAGGTPSVTGSIPAGAAFAANAPKPHAKPGAPVRVASLSTPTRSDAPSVGAQPKRKPATLSSRTGATSSASEPVPPRVARVEAAPTAPISVNRDTGAASNDGERRFRWPAKGRIISDFGSKPGGARNDGINLALPEGTEIKSVEDGTVIYSGNELKGYGSLVLVRHDDGWVSAYAHNSELLVKRGDTVQRGQTVAKAGSTGSVTQPQLHFELRRGNKPVDPMLYLARL